MIAATICAAIAKIQIEHFMCFPAILAKKKKVHSPHLIIEEIDLEKYK